MRFDARPMERSKVLIVDDNQAHRETVGEALEKNFEIVLAPSAEAALRIVCEIQELRAVISDLDLGGMNGADLLEQVMKIDANIQRILMSARLTIPGFDLGSISHAKPHVILGKPTTLRELRSAVK